MYDAIIDGILSKYPLIEVPKTTEEFDEHDDFFELALIYTPVPFFKEFGECLSKSYRCARPESIGDDFITITDRRGRHPDDAFNFNKIAFLFTTTDRELVLVTARRCSDTPERKAKAQKK